MEKSEPSQALKEFRGRTDLISIEEVLERYDAERIKRGWSDETKITQRTLRYWAGKGMVAPPVRGKYNRSLYPEKLVNELLAIRWLQSTVSLTLAQIKILFKDVPLSYYEALAGLNDKSRIDKFIQILSEYSEESRSEARDLILLCSDYLDKEQLKLVASIYKRFDQRLFQQYLEKDYGDLLEEAIASHFLIEDEGAPINDQIESLFKMRLLYHTNRVRTGKTSTENAWEAFQNIKPATYRVAVLTLKSSKLFRLLDK